MAFKKMLSIISLLILLTGCITKKGSFKGNKEIIVIPRGNINQGLSLRMYIVQVYSEEQLSEINGMEADQFFEKVKQLTLAYPEEIKVWECDIIEESRPTCFILPGKKKYWGIIIFFKFIENGENKFNYSNKLRSVELTLQDSQFEITNINNKFKFIKDKTKKPLCIYLSHENCLNQTSTPNPKKKRKE